MPRSLGGTDDETNLITLCRPCHGRMHGIEWTFGHSDLIRAGISRARRDGKTLGRPVVESDADGAAKIERARHMFEGGSGIIKTAKAVGLGTSTIHRLKREMVRTLNDPGS